MNKKRREFLEKAFFEYKQNREKLLNSDRFNEIAGKMLSATTYDRPKVISSCRNVAEEVLLGRIDKDEYLYNLVRLVEMTLVKYSGEYKDNLIKALYFKKMSINRIAYELNIDRSTVFRWKEQILSTAEEFALDLGVLREIKK